MLRIYKGEGEGKKELLVPVSAYENFYKGAGWTKGDVVSEASLEEGDEDEWEGYDDGEEGEEEFIKPLSEMSRSELEAYAAKLGVDLTGLNSNKQYREAIKAAM